MAGWLSKRTTKSARRITLVALLAVLATGAWAAIGAFAANSPSTPTLIANPNVSPTSSATEMFTFTASGAASFQCSLNGSAFTVCTSPKAYGSPTALAEGAYSFQVKALDTKSNASSPASYSWVVDRTAPTVSPPARTGASPANTASVSWTVTFSEPVRNVTATNFSLVNGGLSGSPAITGLSGSGATYTVIASTGGGSGTLGLNLTSKGTISDLAGNAPAGTVPVTGQAYTLDRTPPPAPALSPPLPANPTNRTTATFTFTDTEAGASFQCKLDAGSYAGCSSPAGYTGLGSGSHSFSVQAKDAAGNLSATAASYTWTVDATPPPRPTVTGPNNKSESTAATFTFADSEAGVTFQCSLDNPTTGWSPCASPKTYLLVSPGTHEFDVRAVDGAGNIGDYTGWKWTINGASSGGQPFTIGGISSRTLYPGGSTASIDLSLTNPNSVTIYITSLTVSLASITKPNANPTHPCSAADFSLTQYTGSFPITLPPGTKTLSQLGHATSELPSITMLNRPVNQDGCKGATLTFTYAGSAQS
jgi:hypothetical protein